MTLQSDPITKRLWLLLYTRSAWTLTWLTRYFLFESNPSIGVSCILTDKKNSWLISSHKNDQMGQIGMILERARDMNHEAPLTMHTESIPNFQKFGTHHSQVCTCSK